MRRFVFLLFFFLFLIALPAFAKQLPTVTVINPIRGEELGHEKDNLLADIKAQWQTTHDLGVNATWLWQYSALENTSLVDFAKSEMKKQEFGIFLEIDRNFANKSDVQYRGRGPWYFSDGLLLVSYDEDEREKLIDTVFTKFKETFGYYPKTVGAWWIGADSLDYMQEKYGITGAMKAADQYNLDAYSIWGSPWAIPYVASKENEGIPAGNMQNSSKVVVMQWAVRDPLLAYSTNPRQDLYSTQDFEAKGLDISYFDYLLSIYLKKPLDQILVGLENSRPQLFGDGYHYKTILQEVVRLQKQGKVQISLAKDYSEELIHSGQTLAPTHTFLAKDFKTTDWSFWNISSHYRVSIQQRNNKLYLVDVRNYAEKETESFFTLPNSQGQLLVNTPFTIDSATFPEEEKLLGSASGTLQIKTVKSQTILFSGNKKIAIFEKNNVQIFTTNNKHQTFSFASNFPNISPFSILFAFYFIYSLFIFRKTENKKSFMIQAIFLFLPLILAYPFLTLTNQSLFFDKKELLIFRFLLITPVSFSMKLLLFQTFPFMFLVIVHFFFSIFLNKKYFFYIFALFLVAVFLHLPYFPFDRSTYKIIALCFFLPTVLLFGTGIFLGIKKHSRKIILGTIILLPVICTIVGTTILFSRSKDIIAPFEYSALQFMTKENKPIIYLSTNEKPIYKAVKPLLSDDYKFAAGLTEQKWQIIQRNTKNNLVLTNYTNTILFVPKYLGSYIYPEETASYHLQKVFDNTEIQLFESR